ncbi:MAG: hypothetical protein Q9180_001271, partial [Flavoplaca navasiana]
MAVLSSALEPAVALLVAFCTVYIIQQTVWSPLKSVPGPFFARFSNLWQLFVFYQGKQAQVLRRLHDRYGPVVRIGPRHISLNQPSLIKAIYGLSTSGGFTKSIRYAAFDAKSPDGQNIPVLFSTRDEEHHARMWRPIAKYYSISHLLSFETHIDNVIRTMERRLEQEFCYSSKAGGVCDMHKWLTLAAWEVIMVTNFSQMRGFLKEGKDIEGSLADAVFAGHAFMCPGNVPGIERLLRLLNRKPFFQGVVNFSSHQIAERRGLAGECVHDPPDFLDNFLDAQKAYPDIVDDKMVLAYLNNNIAGGGGTSAGTMSGTMYQILKHPRVLERLQNELDDEVKQTPISWKVASKLPYLDAVIQEAIRFQPGVSFTLERVVPEGGLVLPNGNFIQPGTIVGMHPWVIN